MKPVDLMKLATTLASVAALSACGTSLPADNVAGRHLQPAPEVVSQDIPEVVQSTVHIPEPSIQNAPELFSVVVQDVSVRELLFAIARDAGINIDVHPDVVGVVSLNAIDQTLPQILDRIGRQVDIRWQMDLNNGLMVELDTPYFKTYRVDYVNVARESSTGFNVSTSLTTVGGATGGSSQAQNNSVASLAQNSSNSFWATLSANLRGIMGEASDATEGSNIITNPESGIVTINANSRQHREIQRFLDFVRTRSLYQVMIEATVVEVTLSDQFQSGVDWATLSRDNAQVDFLQSMSGLNLSSAPASMLTIDKSAGPDAVSMTMRMLSQFGDIRVLSSPKLMALNNQAAMLRVVDNKVYFTVDVQAGTPATANGPGTPAVYTSTINTVPVGFVMSVTPQISENDQVTLNVRPTISRVVRYVNDPNPTLADNNVVNGIPEIQIREIESILKVNSGQIAVLGGLMQDSIDTSNTGLPGLSRLPGVGGIFGYKNEIAHKTELIVFIRPVVIKDPSLDGDLNEFRDFLPEKGISSDGFLTSQISEADRR